MAAFETKQYRNLFSLIGKEDQEINNRLNEIFETFFYGSEEERIYHPAGEDMGYPGLPFSPLWIQALKIFLACSE